MALTLYEAAKMSRNPLAAGLFLAIATSDEFISQLPMVRKPGESFRYNREKALPTAEWVAPDHSSLTESSATADNVTVPMRLLVSDVDTYIFAEEQQGDIMAQRSTQLTQKLKAAGRTIANAAINGAYATSVAVSPGMAGVASHTSGPLQDTDRHGPGELFYDQSEEEMYYRAPGDRAYGPAVSTAGDPGAITLYSDNPNKYITITVASTAALPAGDAVDSVTIASTSNQPDGMLRLCPSSQTIASTGANGDALAFTTMDALIDLVKTKNNLAFVCNGAIRRKYYALVRALGGTDPMHITLPGVTGQVPTYRGIPILRTDNIASTEAKGGASTLSSLMLVDLAAEEGFFAGVAGGAATANLTPMQTRIMGLRVREIGELESKEARRQRVSWYGAFGLGSELAIARASQLVTA